MIRKKSNKLSWPYTPEPSPHLEPSVYPLEEVPGDFAMSGEELPRARPISMMSRKDGVMSPGRPTLDEVLNNTAPQPYTLAAYTAFLSQQHCLETLEFTTEAKKYAEKYDEVSAHLAGIPMTIDTDEGYDLIQDWKRILDIYVKPGAPREINLPAEERDDLVEQSADLRPPQPEAFEPAIKRMYDLMSESIFIPFCNSLKTVSYAQTYSTMSAWQPGDLDVSRLTFDERAMHQRIPSRRRRSPRNTSAASFETTRSPPHHRPTQSSSLSSALDRQSGVRLSTHVTHSSAVPEDALTDSSNGRESPPAGEQESMVTPPTTPPTNDLHAGSSASGHGNGNGQLSGLTSIPLPKSQRTESGGWKKMAKIFGGGSKKKGGSFND